MYLLKLFIAYLIGSIVVILLTKKELHDREHKLKNMGVNCINEEN